jgi:hypothetical protein
MVKNHDRGHLFICLGKKLGQEFSRELMDKLLRRRLPTMADDELSYRRYEFRRKNQMLKTADDADDKKASISREKPGSSEPIARKPWLKETVPFLHKPNFYLGRLAWAVYERLKSTEALK